MKTKYLQAAYLACVFGIGVNTEAKSRPAPPRAVQASRMIFIECVTKAMLVNPFTNERRELGPWNTGFQVDPSDKTVSFYGDLLMLDGKLILKSAWLNYGSSTATRIEFDTDTISGGDGAKLYLDTSPSGRLSYKSTQTLVNFAGNRTVNSVTFGGPCHRVGARSFGG